MEEPKKYLTRTEERIDMETGELVKSKEYNVKLKKEPYVMIFKEGAEAFCNIKRIADMKLFLNILNRIEYNTNLIALPVGVKKILAEEAGISFENISRNIKRLIDLDLIRGERGLFRVNPLWFWKGDRGTRFKLIKELVLSNNDNEPTPDFTSLQNKLDKANYKSSDDGDKDYSIRKL